MNKNLSPVQEIDSYLAHGDQGLANRRLLDLCLDTDSPDHVREAIHISQKFHSGEIENARESAMGLLKKLETFQIKGNKKSDWIEAESITKTYSNGNFSLKPSSLRIGSGDILGVVGENGNGKTTLLRCLAGQLGIDSGSIRYAELKESDPFAIRQKVAFIPQRIPRWYGFLKDNLHFSASIAGIHGEKNEWMVDFMLERLGLARYAELTWNQISSGYRTRFEIARVLLQRPHLLILDEPLANLDINAQQTILTDLRFMSRSLRHPMGVVLSSQQLHEVEKVADHILFIRNGECLYHARTGEKTGDEFVLEMETPVDRETLLGLFGEGISVRYNGGFYTLISNQLDAQTMLKTLVMAGVPITYARDITHSTKRFFN